MKLVNKTFLHFELSAQALAIGERIKGGTFRPCIETIPTSTLKGSFRDNFGLPDVLAIGIIKEGTYQKDIFTYAPFDSFLSIAKLPISLEYLKPGHGTKEIIADIYALKNESTESLIGVTTEMSLGALKSKGFGRCELRYIGELKPEVQVGYLKGRLLEEECDSFGISRVIKACYGYLFYPTSKVSGVYRRAIFEESIVEGPEILIREAYKYDY